MDNQASLTPKQAEELHRLIRSLVRAEVADSWKGGGYPDDIPIIEGELKAARIRIKLYINRLTKGAKS